MTERTTRELNTRANTQPKRAWAPPTLLPDPPPDKDYVYKWVRAASLGQADPSNMNKKTREGWELVKRDDPAAAGIMQATDAKTAFTDTVEIGGLVLARMPKEMADQRNAHYAGQGQQMIESLDNSAFKDSDPRMPVFSERKSSTGSNP